jgi:N-acylglucosamine 2-epimerase
MDFMLLNNTSSRHELAALYRQTLVQDVIPFWLRHGMDQQYGGYFTCLNRDGSLLDTDKSIWFQGRGAWMFATLYNTVEAKPLWLTASRSGIDFLRRHGFAVNGKMYFSVTRDGQPLRMRRYAYSEAFTAMAYAAFARAASDEQARTDAVACFASYLRYSFAPGWITPKVDAKTRPSLALGPFMIGLSTAQEVRAHLGDVAVSGRTCTQWIDWCIQRIETLFVKAELQAVLETAGPNGEILDHFDGRLLNPGHALEAAWFILHESQLRDEPRYLRLGLNMLEWMWQRGWDEEYGGLYAFRDLRGLPVQEYWHDMKFWWPHCEAILATALAWSLTGEDRYAQWHQLVHEWSFRHFADPEKGEWYGYLHRDGRISVPLKGNLWKGPFHLPRMLWYTSRLLDSAKLKT